MVYVFVSTIRIDQAAQGIMWQLPYRVLMALCYLAVYSAIYLLFEYLLFSINSIYKIGTYLSGKFRGRSPLLSNALYLNCTSLILDHFLEIKQTPLAYRNRLVGLIILSTDSMLIARDQCICLSKLNVPIEKLYIGTF